MTKEKLADEIFQACRRLDTNRPFSKRVWLRELRRIEKLNKRHKLPLEALIKYGLEAETDS